ncbi:MAG: hypothetical protein KAT70_06545, partial [Thermoplasmata archaeon]|nr:hypothetical protein [Thermoplasmata archaeon]
MKRWVWPGLLCAVFLSMAMRIWPLTQGVFWGVDSAEYYGILQGLQDTGALPTAGYAGFGVTYPYFPGFFHVTFLPAVAGMDLLTSLRWTIPLLGSLSVLLAFLLALEITGDERVAVLASLFLAAFSPHVLQGARPMPGTLGEILMLASIFFFVRASKEDRDRGECWALFLISGFALVVTHHLSALFLVVILSGGMLMDNLFRETESPRAAIRAGMLLAITAFMGMFWLSISSFRSAILGNLPGPPMLLAFLPCAGPIIAMAPLALGEHRLGPGKMRRGWMRLSLPVGVVTAVVGGLGLDTLGYFAGAPDFLALFLFMLPTVLVICLL